MSVQLADALEKFLGLFAEAETTEPFDASTMSLATTAENARPTVRVVSFSGIANASFSFFANERSGKGAQMADNPWAALCFYWPKLRQQVVVEGRVGKLDDATADQLWRARPRKSALMAWVSHQSDEHRDDDGALDERVKITASEFGDERVPRPARWRCYAIIPNRIEFWRGDWDLRKPRESYVETEEGWKLRLLEP